MKIRLDGLFKEALSEVATKKIPNGKKKEKIPTIKPPSHLRPVIDECVRWKQEESG